MSIISAPLRCDTPGVRLQERARVRVRARACARLKNVQFLRLGQPLGLRIQPLLKQANISIKHVQPFSLPSKAQWTQNLPNVILDLHENKKSEVDSHIFKTEFLEIKSAYKHYMSIYTDGSKQNEKVACAVISPYFTDSIRLPNNSSIFTAEAKAIDIALYHIRDQPEKQFIIYSDSLSVL